ncbi:ABC transporter substrate-binding protein [Jonquetella anthropi]|uniref:ABC transporter substrate-binding protein n=1 Tax=Jonquetella anthropi TaxID=428712 RepID=UPI0001B91482|nr:ABC transporter substrate-binding protein [Jonquetella anthropi]EEX47894.1 ABC transporter, substrate-binding protein, family 5 [Jonquetella anthropi E3_33 E1]
MSKKFFALLAGMCLFAGAAWAKGDTLTVANIYDAKSLDPVASNDVASAGVCIHIYDNLLTITNDNKLVPQLATKWEQIDPKTFKFYLRQGVKFHNGEPFTANDVVYTVNRAKSDVGAAMKQYTDPIDSVEKIDDYTVVFHLKYPYTPFVMTLTHMWGGIVNKKAVEAAGDSYGMNPVGTGAFKFVSWAKNDRITLERNDDYWGDKPAYKTLVMRSISEDNSRTIALESGDVDIAYQISPMDIQRVEENPDLEIHRVNTTSITYLGMNCSKKPLDDVRVRQAIWYALDVPTIHDAAWHGVGSIPKSAISPEILYSATDLPQYTLNVEKAKELLKEAGVQLPLHIELWTNELQQRQDMAQMIQAYLKAVDIQVDIKVLEWGAYLSGLTEKKHDMYILGWSASVPDPDVAVYGVLASKGPSNYTYFSDPTLDELLEKGRQLPSGDERQATYHKAQEEIHKQAPWVYLHLSEDAQGAQKYVKNFFPSPISYTRLTGVTFEE